MNIALKWQDYVSPGLRRIERDMPKIEDVVLGSVAKDYRDFVRSRYLSGQLLKRGKPWEAMTFKRMRRGHWKVGPGRFNALAIFETGGVIVPRKRKVLRFYDDSGEPVFRRQVRIPRRPFMSASLAAYLSLGLGMQRAEGALRRELSARIGVT
ncbi:MAG: hypothetical protein ABIF82_00580 [Planctomycetota bacterium]